MSETIPNLPEAKNEILVTDHARDVDAGDLSTLAFSLAKYQRFDDELPTAVLAYVTGQLGVVVWNLEPGQENEYHVHPASEHLHLVIAGTCQYTLGDQPPREATVGDAVMIPAGVAHCIRNLTDQRASYVAIVSPGPYERIVLDRPDD